MQFSQRKVWLSKFLLNKRMWKEKIINIAILIRSWIVEELFEEVLVALVFHF